MTVRVRSKRTENIKRRPRASSRHFGRHAVPAAPSAVHAMPAAPSAVAAHPNGRAASQPRLANDHAFYNCQCGYVFQAPVSTSVGCPHCGGTQAW